MCRGTELHAQNEHCRRYWNVGGNEVDPPPYFPCDYSPFSIHPLCLLPAVWGGGNGWRKYSRCREKDNRILVRKKKEGRKKDM